MDYLFPDNPSQHLNSGLAPELVAQVGHGSPITSVAFSPDGRQLLTGSMDNVARLWDVDTGLELRCFHGHTDELTAVACAPGGLQVMTGSKDNTVRIWDSRTASEQARFVWENVLSLIYTSDGSYVLSLEGNPPTATLWDLQQNSQLKFGAPGDHHTYVTYSPARQEILTCSGTHSALWDLEGQLVCEFPAPASFGAISADGNVIALGLYDFFEPANHLWTREGKQLATFTPASRLTMYKALHLLPDQERLLAISTDESIAIWNLNAMHEPMVVIQGACNHHLVTLSTTTLTPNGSHLVRRTGDGSTLEMIDMGTGQATREFQGEGKSMYGSMVSPDGNRLNVKNRVRNSGETFYAAWDLGSGSESFRTTDIPVGYTDHDRFLVVHNDTTTTLLTTDSGVPIREFKGLSKGIDLQRELILTDSHVVNHEGHIERPAILDDSPFAQILAVAPDLSTVLYYHNVTIWLWDTFTGSRRWTFDIGQTAQDGLAQNPFSLPPQRYPAQFSPDGEFIIVSGLEGGIRRFDTTTGASEIVALENAETPYVSNQTGESVGAMTLWDSTTLAVALDNQATLWDLDTGQPLDTCTAHSSPIHTLSHLPGTEWLFAGGANTTQLVNRSDGLAYLQLLSLVDGTWVVIDKEGRFDTNNLEEIRGIHWVMPDEPMRPLPLEVFMRTFYEPRLLTRILKGEILSPVPDISQINRVQPDVQITEVIPDLGNPEDPHVSVSLTVRSMHQYLPAAEGGYRALESGVWDVHLFRDGQLVRVFEGDVLEAGTDEKTFTVDRINLPRTGVNQVAFTAYAFNKDRVKSKTARLEYTMPETIPVAKGRAFLISVGVNVYEDPSWNLNFAVNDARDMQASLTNHLTRQGEYDVIPIRLLSDGETSTATRAHFKAVIDRLAGRPVDAPEVPSAIANNELLTEARPEDLIFFSFAGHGYTGDGFLGEQGAFYFLFSDIGTEASTITPEVLDRTLSSDTLTRWLTDVDAGDLIFIIDACHSASSVEGAGFKPGPMGSRGLGQMAYNKGMLIMAASAADDVALESDSLEQGLLTYVLIEEGLNKQKADFGSATFQHADATIKLKEWLQYGAIRVPELCREIDEGKHRGLALTRGARGERTKVTAKEVSYQQPAVFNYRKKKSDIVLWSRDT